MVTVAYSNGNGTFDVSNVAAPSFPQDASSAGAQLVAGDFNGDHKADLAVSGGLGWNTVPVAFSTGSAFNVTNTGNASFAAWSQN
jgi:hypothetical protein